MLYKTLNNSYFEGKNIYSPILGNISEKNEIENYCFDCGHGEPEFISINNGVLICEKCGFNHMTFPPGVSILIKNEKNSLSETESQFLLLGGNQKLYKYILNKSPNLINLPRKVLYTSLILNSYRKKLCDLVYKVSMNQINYSNIKNNNSVSPTSNSYLDKKFYTINTENELINNKILNDNELKMNNNSDNINKKETSNIFFGNNRKFNKHYKILLKKSNVIYNKPKLQSIFNKIKTEKKEYIKEIKNIRPRISKRLFTYKNIFNNSFVNSKDIIHSINSSLSEKATIPSEDKIMYKYSSKTLNRNKDIDKYEIFKSIKINKNITSEKTRQNNFKSGNIKYEKNDYSYLNNLSKYQEVMNKNIKDKRKIREIIINKKMNNNNSYIYDNYLLNTLLFQSIRRPIQVNLSLQNTIDNSQINYISQFRCNETPTIIIHNTSTNTNSTEKNVQNEKDMKNNNNKIFRAMSENAIKTININMAKNIKIKNIKSNNGTHSKYITVMKKDNLKSKGKKEPIKKGNVDHFQILPVKTYRKINNSKRIFVNLEANKESRNHKDEKEFNKKRRKISPYRSETNYGNRNENNNYNNAFIENKKLKKIMVSSSFKEISIPQKGETFINSIRSKYKREKSKQN
jgi:hypothetical protein